MGDHWSRKIAHGFVRDLAAVQPTQQITSVLGTDQKATASFAREFSLIGLYTSLDQFIGEGNPHVVYIGTPHPEHYEQALACLLNKIPVLCEKTLMVNA